MKPAPLKKPRMKKCKACGVRFEPIRPMQSVCGPPCAARFAKDLREKAERKVTRERIQLIKTRSQIMKEAQAAFNAFVRERDKGQPCICCGAPLTLEAVGGGYDCGHYRSVGSAPHLRFDERNAHAQRKVCNRYGAGRAVDYRIGLIERIGLAAVEALETDQDPRHWSREDLIQIRDDYRAKLRALKKEIRRVEEEVGGALD